MMKQTLWTAVLAFVVGGFLLYVFIDGIYNDFVSEFFVWTFKVFGMSHQEAVDTYWYFIGNNKQIFVFMGFMLLFSVFFYIGLSKIVKYLRQIEDGVQNIVSDASEEVSLSEELLPLEQHLNDIKRTLKKQEKIALENEKKKNDLVLFLAHDLKTPLTSVVAYLSMLNSQPDMQAEEREKYIQISLEKATRLGEFISEFFEIAKYNLQDIVLEKTEINLTMMLEQLSDELYGILQEKNLTCQIDIGEDMKVIGDSDKLARVFDNILRNAIAYCAEGSEIRIMARQKGKKTRIIFANKGVPIPKEKLNIIFEKFYRADDARSSETGGAGLGLAIAKAIVKVHEGEIFAESSQEETRFVVELPTGNETGNKAENKVENEVEKENEAKGK